MLVDTLFMLLHLLVFAYWLGGDIGVFYASTLLTDEKRDTAGRIAAAKILGDVDLAPRICLLLAFPTGLALAGAKGWLSVGALPITLTFIIAFAWIGLVMTLHVRHDAALFKRIDTILRYGFLVALAGAAIARFAGALDLPLFLALKFFCLAFAISMGLFVRQALGPFAPAFAKLATAGPDDETNKAIKDSLDRARPAVVAIWIALIAAAWFGVATPV